MKFLKSSKMVVVQCQVARIREVRKAIARMKTVIREREISGDN